MDSGEQRPGECKIGIELYRAPQIIDGLVFFLLRGMRVQLLHLQIQRVSLGIQCGRGVLRGRIEQRHPERLHYGARDFILDFEDVVELAIVGL